MNLNTKIINFPPNAGDNEILLLNGTTTNSLSLSDYDSGQFYFNNFSTLINKIGSNPNEELVLIDSSQQHSCNSSSTASTSQMSPLSGIFKLNKSHK